MACDKNIRIIFDTYFEKPENKKPTDYMDQDRIRANLEACGRNNENHLLLSHLTKVNRRSVLPPQVRGDQSRLQQVLINLIRNAIDNSYDSGWVQITINYDYKENQLICIIKDNGPGIQMDQQLNIFKLMHLPNTQKKLAHLVHN